jgi:pilus assembly protein CpaC
MGFPRLGCAEFSKTGRRWPPAVRARSSNWGPSGAVFGILLMLASSARAPAQDRAPIPPPVRESAFAQAPDADRARPERVSPPSDAAEALPIQVPALVPYGSPTQRGPVRDRDRDRDRENGVVQLGAQPTPSAETLKKFGRFIDRVIDPENTFEVVIGRPRVVLLKEIPDRFQLEDDQTARVIPLFQNKQLSVTGLKVGTTVLNMWFKDPANPRSETILSYLVNVLPDPESKERLRRVYNALGREINRLFPNSIVRLSIAGDKVVVSGQAKDIVEATQILRIVRANVAGSPGQGQIYNQNQGQGQGQGIGLGPGQLRPSAIPLPVTQVASTGINPATGALTTVNEAVPGLPGQELPTIEDYMLSGGPNVINLLQIPGEQQIMLRVTVAEINRAASRSIGVDFSVVNGVGKAVFTSSLAGAFNTSQQNNGGSGTNNSAQGINNMSAIFSNGSVTAAITALRTMNFARTLAEPNLTTTNGQPAAFQAGGEFPVPVTTGTTFTGLQGVVYVPYGVMLRFVPYITDKDRVRLMVSSNVSARDPATGTTIGGASVTGLTTRNFQTTVELRDGQTLAVAGLIQNTYGANSARVPFFGDLPVIGRLASIDGTSNTEQELVVLVTPMLVHPYDPHQVPPLPGSDVYEPGDIEFYLQGRLESRRAIDYRSTVRTDIDRMARYRHCEDLFISGPHGHSPSPR